MTLDQAIRLIDPATTAEELERIYAYGGFHGNEVTDAVLNEAIRIALEVMRNCYKEKSKMTLNEFCSLVGGDMGPATINVFQKDKREKYYVSENEGFKEFTIQSVFPADSFCSDEYANAEDDCFLVYWKRCFRC